MKRKVPLFKCCICTAILSFLCFFLCKQDSGAAAENLKSVEVLMNSKSIFSISKKETAEDFAKRISAALQLTKTEKSYSELLFQEGIYTKEMIDSEIITRGQAFLALKKTCERLGIEENELMKVAKEKKRLSDLDRLNKGQREAAYFVYALGIVEGSSEGAYTKTRKMNADKPLIVQDAMLYIRRVLDSKKRRELTADGQLTRTSNLPKYKEWYPYILDSFPNAFYDWELRFMQAGRMPGQEPLIDCTPRSFPNFNMEVNNVSVQEYLQLNGDSYVQLAEEYLQHLFNVDYRTIQKDNQWYQYILNSTSTHGENDKSITYSGLTEEEYLITALNQYIGDVKRNETVIECDKAVVDLSCVYCSFGEVYLRGYVHYKINSAKTLLSTEGATRNPVLFTPFSISWFSEAPEEEWRESFVNIQLDIKSGQTEVFPQISDIWISDWDIEHPVFFK